MTNRVLSALTLAGTICLAAEVGAAPIAATNLDTWIGGGSAGVQILGPTVDLFTTAAPPPPTIGTLTNYVWFNGATGDYTYTHTVVPTVNNVSEFNTGFGVAGFTGTAGFSFGQSLTAGGTGTAADFGIDLDLEDGSLDFESAAIGTGFDIGETVTFFFVSKKAPTTGDYNIINSEVGTAQSFAPVSEPGTIALLASGMVGLYGSIRRRRARA